MNMPDVLLGYEDVHFTAAEIAERQAAISRNSQKYLQAWREGKINPGLYAYQEPAFETLLEFTYETGLAIQPSLDAVTIESGYLDEPTSWGKTALIAKYSGAIGIGTLPTPESPMPLRALVGTLAAYAVQQTAGAADVTRGLKKFLPHMDISMCFAEQKRLSGEISVITYAMLRRLAAAGILKDYYVDVVLGDEAHSLLAPQTKKIWKRFTELKRAIGLTASPEYTPNKKISQLFDRLVHESTLRTHVEAGNVSSVQILGFGTGVEIEPPARADADFSDAGLESLMFNPQRNQAICDITVQMIAEGRRGVVNALPGQHKGQTLFHPRLLAKALDGREVEDDFGNKRQIRAAAIGTHITPKECERVLEGFKKGKYDVIIQVDKINQSFDCEDVAFIVNAAPTMSRVRAIQRIGRLMRPNEDWPIKMIIEFIDDIKGMRIPYTAWHVLGERDMKQNQVIATPELHERLAEQEFGHHRRGMRGGGGSKQSSYDRFLSVPDPHVFTDLLRAMHQDYTLRLVDSFLLKAKEGYGPPQQGWRRLQTVVAEKYNDKPIGIDGIRGLLERAGEKAGKTYCELALGRGPVYFVSPEGEKFLAAYEFPKTPPSQEWKTERELSEVLQTTREMIQRCSVGLPRTTYLAHRINREHEHFGPDEIAVLKSRVEELKRQEKEAQALVAARDLAAEPNVNWNRTSINYFLTSHYGIAGRVMKNPDGRADARFYTNDEADIVRRHRRHSYQVTQTELAKRTVIDLERETGRTRDEILAAAAVLGFSDRVKDGRHKDKEGAYIYSELTSPWVAGKISEYFQNMEANLAPQTEAASTAKSESTPPPPPPTQTNEAAAESTLPKMPQPVTFMAAGKLAVAPAAESSKPEPPSRHKPPQAPRPPVAASVETAPSTPASAAPPESTPPPPAPPPVAKPPALTPQPQQPPPKSSTAEQPTETAPANDEQLVDVLKTLESYGAPCDLGAVRRVAEECGLKPDAVRRTKTGFAATQDAILTMAVYITDLPEAMADVETPADLAYRLGLHVDDVIDIVQGLAYINKQAMVGLYRRSMDSDSPGVAGLFFELQLRSLVEKASQNRRMLPSRDKNPRGPGKRR